MITISEFVLEKLASYYELTREDLTFLGGGREDSDGTAFSCTWNDKPMVLKVLAVPDDQPDGLLRHNERIRFVRFLGENGAQIVFPHCSSNGNLYETFHEGTHTFLAYLMDKVEGRHLPAEEWDDRFFHRCGKAVGMMHRLATQYPQWSYSIVNADPEKRVLGWYEEWEGFYNWCQDVEVKAQWNVMRERLEQLPLTREVFGFIHNDPHVNNILMEGDKLSILDFDVANYHWFINDIAVAMQGVLFTQSGGMERPLQDPAPIRRFLEHFMNGYEEEYHLDPVWLEHLDVFIAYRRMLLFTVMQEWLDTKPDVKQMWKQLILEDPAYICQQVLA